MSWSSAARPTDTGASWAAIIRRPFLSMSGGNARDRPEYWSDGEMRSKPNPPILQHSIAIPREIRSAGTVDSNIGGYDDEIFQRRGRYVLSLFLCCIE